jgi:hypothetical protein
VSKVLRRSDAALVFQIPCDRQYLETVRDLAARIVEYIGYQRHDARGVGESVDALVGRFVAAASPDDLTASVEVTFRTGATAVEIWIRYRGDDEGGARAVDLERALRGETGPGGALASIREAVDGVEIGREGGVTFCCLTRDLPPDA